MTAREHLSYAIETFTKANGILKTYGEPTTQEEVVGVSYTRDPWRTSGILPQVQVRETPILQAPITPIQLGENEYKLWLRRETKPDEGEDESVTLSVYFQRLPQGVERVEEDSEGWVTGYYKREGEKLIHVGVVRSPTLPRELEFYWYLAKRYDISPHAVVAEPLENVPEEISEPLWSGSNSLLRILEQMEQELQTQPR